ncbi:hypothetical protein [uncultured Sharpea sp.]|uniref:hypothetical protein n=1 Tax=uncultured Sharpea sp. TaxID=1112738 RepID=UPI00258E6E58|nr:hypothetical protein [uncultured Sharpea sp.]
MKPLKLEMQAFSTYLERTVVDFERLNQAGLYLMAAIAPAMFFALNMRQMIFQQLSN